MIEYPVELKVDRKFFRELFQGQKASDVADVVVDALFAMVGSADSEDIEKRLLCLNEGIEIIKFSPFVSSKLTALHPEQG